MSDATMYSPYRESYDSTIQEYYFNADSVTVGYDDDRVISKNLTLGELRKSSFVLPDEQNLYAYIPIDTRVIKAFQILRDALGNAIVPTSSFRSVRYELSKGRSGNSQHTFGKALDLKGVGLVDLVLEALESKNELYEQLRAVGINGFGVYESDGFVHIDVRDDRLDGSYAYWNGSEDDELKKKGLSISGKAIAITVGVVLVVLGLFKKLKD